MTQETASESSGAVSAARPDGRSRAPGLLPAAAAVVLSAVLFWVWLSTGGLKGVAPANDALTATSGLAPVDDQEIAAALKTMFGTPEFLAKFKKDSAACPLPLAWITLARAPGSIAETVRVRSGSYYSPLFDVPEVPVRVAVPYPAAYEMGHGSLGVLGVKGEVVAALTPAWHVTPQSGAAREVTWPALKRCGGANG
jgi:hypothetical protein